MVEIKLTVANDDIRNLRAFCASAKTKLTDEMVAGQATRRTGAATFLYTFFNRIDQQLADHLQRLEEDS